MKHVMRYVCAIHLAQFDWLQMFAVLPSVGAVTYLSRLANYFMWWQIRNDCIVNVLHLSER